MRDLLRRDAAGVLSRFGSAHAIADGESEIHAVGWSFAKFAQVLHFPSIKTNAQEGVFVIGSNGAALRPSRPSQAGGSGRRVVGMAHGVRMVASSKSTTQKRPSDWR